MTAVLLRILLGLGSVVLAVLVGDFIGRVYILCDVVTKLRQRVRGMEDRMARMMGDGK